MINQPQPSYPEIGRDTLAQLVREKFDRAREYRQAIESDRWLPGEDAYNGIFPDAPVYTRTSDRPPFMAITRREVASAHIKINALMFQNGEIPFVIQPTRYPRFVPSDIHQFADGMAEMSDRERRLYLDELRKELPIDTILRDRAKNIENRIRDVLDRTDFTNEISKCIHELILHGTGVMKSPVLIHRNYPVYRGRYANRLQRIESAIEEELLPASKFVSIFNLYPSPEAESLEDVSYIIERKQLSSVQVRQMLTEQRGFDLEALTDVLDRHVYTQGDEIAQPLNPHQESYSEEEKEYELLEFWGALDKDDLEGYIDTDQLDNLTVLPVCLYVLGDRTVKATLSPYDGMLPYHFGYWQRVPHSIWGDGVFWSIRDVQSLLNFSMAMYVEGKQISSLPMAGMDASQLAANEDPTDLYPGKIFQFAPGADVGSAFKPVVIPDVTHGLMDMMQFLQREANLSSGQSPIGMGQTAPYQTRTATGMSILNTNAQKQTASVVQSISNILRGAINGIYRWLLVDTDDPNLHCDAEAICTGYDRFVAEEIHNQQMLQFLQTVMNIPGLTEQLRMDRFAKPMLRAFNLNPEEMLKTPEEMQQSQQQREEAAQKQMQMEAQSKALLAQIDQQKSKLDAALEERKSIGEQRRDLEIRRIMNLMENGQDPGPITDFTNLSVIIKEELQKQKMLEMQRMEQQRAQEIEREQQLEQLEEAEYAELRSRQARSNSPANAGRGASATAEPNVAAPRGVPAVQNPARISSGPSTGEPGPM